MRILLDMECLAGFISKFWNKETKHQHQKLVESITKNAAEAWQKRAPEMTHVRFLQQMSETPLRFRFLTVREENGELIIYRREASDV